MQGLTQLVELDLSRNSMMGAVSDTVASSCSLQSLDVSQNKLTTMPATMSQLSQLTELRLGFNDFRKLPEEIAALPALRVLDFRDNHIASLSASFARYISQNLFRHRRGGGGVTSRQGHSKWGCIPTVNCFCLSHATHSRKFDCHGEVQSSHQPAKYAPKPSDGGKWSAGWP